MKAVAMRDDARIGPGTAQKRNPTTVNRQFPPPTLSLNRHTSPEQAFPALANATGIGFRMADPSYESEVRMTIQTRQKRVLPPPGRAFSGHPRHFLCGKFTAYCD